MITTIPASVTAPSAFHFAAAIGRRGAWRDYVDLYAICTIAGMTLEEIVADAEKKFGTVFSSKLFFEQLTYLDDIADFSIEPLHKTPPSPETIRSYFTLEATKLLRDA